MGNGPGRSSHDILNSSANLFLKGLLFLLKSCCSIMAIQPSFSFDMPKLSEVLRYWEWDVGGGGRSLYSPCAPWP